MRVIGSSPDDFLGVVSINNPAISHWQHMVVVSKKGMLHITSVDEAESGAARLVKTLDLNQISQTEEGRQKIHKYFQEHRIAFEDENHKLHIHKNLSKELKGKLEDNAVVFMDDSEYEELKDVVDHVVSILNDSKEDSKREKSRDAQAQQLQTSERPHYFLNFKNAEAVSAEFRTKINDIISKMLETFAEAAKQDNIRKEEDYKKQIIKEDDLKQRLLTWNLKVWNIKVDNVKVENLLKAFMVYDRHDRARDWVLLHPHNAIGELKQS